MKTIENIEYSKDHRRIDLKGRILVAHQAEFMPWLGFVSKATMGDLYFVLDNSQFKKEYFENRNKIRIKNDPGWQWLTIPITNKNKIQNILNVNIKNSNWKNKILKAIEFSYKKTPFFNYYFGILYDIIFNYSGNKLVDLNYKIIEFVFHSFKINIPVFRTSELVDQGYEIKGEASELVLSMCKTANADVFIAGISGKNYLNKELFKENGIKLVFQNFSHPEYPQIHGKFIPNMSFIDILFNVGEEEAIKILGKYDYEEA